MENELKCVPFEAIECPKCESVDAEVLTKSKKKNWIYDGDQARCKRCQHTGLVNVEGSDCTDIIWDEL